MLRLRSASLLVVTLVALSLACGHRGNPLPPLRRTPPAPQGFRLAQRGDALEVRATAPTASVEGVAYEAVTVEFLYVEGPRDIEKAGHRRSVQATPGRRVVERLPLPAPGTTVRVAARSVVGGEKGQRTLTQALVAQAPLEAPHDLAAVLTADGVALSWRGVRPKEAAPPALLPTPPAPAPKAAGERGAGAKAVDEVPPRHGFFVYRRLGGAAYDAPLVEEPLEQRRLDDTVVPQGETACYVVRAVASVEPLV
jgi:hypothetical protein